MKLALKLAMSLEEGTFNLEPQITKASLLERTKLGVARTAFIEFKVSEGKQPKTWGKYDGTLKDFVTFAAEKKVGWVDQVKLTLIDAYLARRVEQKVRGKKIGAVQIYHDMSLLKRFFAWCFDRKMSLENPLANQTYSRPTQRRKERIPTLDEVNAILAALPSRVVTPVAVLAFGGMRSSNCRNLLVSDIDLRAGWIHIRSRDGARTKVGNEWKVPIHPRLAAALRMIVMPKEGYLFTAPPSPKYADGGHWINTKHLNTDFVAVVGELGLPAGRENGFTIHSLRHFFKSFCLSNGVPREYVDSWQGHQGIKTASDLYVHTFDADSQRFIREVPFGTD